MAKLYTFFHCNHGRIITSSTQYNRQSFDVFLNYIYDYITVSFILVFVHGRTVWIPAFLTGYHRNQRRWWCNMAHSVKGSFLGNKSTKILCSSEYTVMETYFVPLLVWSLSPL